VSFLLAGLLTISLVGISSPAQAALNRCGDAYTAKTDWYRFAGDRYAKPITKFRIRAVPGTQRTCAEYSHLNRDQFRIKNVQIQIIQGDDTKKVCFALHCTFRTHQRTTKYLFALTAKRRGTYEPFYSYTNSIRVTY
jgi:hypothetical protein